MPVKDNNSSNVLTSSDGATVATDTTTTFITSIDTKDLDNGISFGLLVTAYTDGDYALVIQDSADNSVFADVDSSMVIGTPVSVDAAYTEGDAIPKIGVFGTRRYLRATVVSTNTSTGATMQVVTQQSNEVVPSSE